MVCGVCSAEWAAQCFPMRLRERGLNRGHSLLLLLLLSPPLLPLLSIPSSPLSSQSSLLSFSPPLYSTPAFVAAVVDAAARPAADRSLVAEWRDRPAYRHSVMIVTNDEREEDETLQPQQPQSFQLSIPPHRLTRSRRIILPRINSQYHILLNIAPCITYIAPFCSSHGR